MKHIILFENFFNSLDEATTETMKSGAKLYRGDGDEIAPGEMVVTISEKNTSIKYNNKTKQKVYEIIFNKDLGSTYNTEGGFGTKTVSEGGKEVKGAGIIFSTKDLKGDGPEAILSIPYQGKSDADFSAALLSFLVGLDGGLQNFDGAKMAVNSIAEIFKGKDKDSSPDSLKRAGSQIVRASQLPDVNILAGTTETERTLNKKLKASVKAFLAELG
jgi:hypothetical protein